MNDVVIVKDIAILHPPKNVNPKDKLAVAWCTISMNFDKSPAGYGCGCGVHSLSRIRKPSTA